jgi:putative FmdB family regulatory protein
MPIYEYECKNCHHKLETLQKVSEPALTDCSECGKATLQKIISSTSFQLKGTGWYETDFRTKTPSPATPPSDTKKSS